MQKKSFTASWNYKLDTNTKGFPGFTLKALKARSFYGDKVTSNVDPVQGHTMVQDQVFFYINVQNK